MPFNLPRMTQALLIANVLGFALQYFIGDQAMLDRLFAELDTHKRGLALLDAFGLSFDHPHYSASTFSTADAVHRRRLSVVLCGDRRGARTLHHSPQSECRLRDR